MSFSYVEFENRFRGTFDDVLREQEPYLEYFRAAPGPVVDLGSGRGEFLTLMARAGLAAYGVEPSAEMRACCAGLDVRAEEALSHLQDVADAGLGGIFMSHLIEHLPRPDVLRFAELAARKLAPGGAVVIETLNPQCLFAYAPFCMDLTHRWPIHPQTLEFILEANGFVDFQYRYRQYLPDEMLQFPTGPAPAASELERAFGEAMSRLQLIVNLAFKNFIYAVAARKP